MNDKLGLYVGGDIGVRFSRSVGDEAFKNSQNKIIITPPITSFGIEILSYHWKCSYYWFLTINGHSPVTKEERS